MPYTKEDRSCEYKKGLFSTRGQRTTTLNMNSVCVMCYDGITFTIVM